MRWPIAVLAAVVAALGGAALLGVGRPPAARAASGASVLPGAGRWIAGHTDFVGAYRAWIAGRWVTVYCISPQLRTPSRITLAPSGRLGGAGLTATRQVAQTLSAHGATTSAVQAEAVSQAVNYELGHRVAVARRARYLGPTVALLARRYVLEARRELGPYVLTLRLDSAPLPGQSGRAALTLRGPGGGRAATVRLTTGAAVTAPATVRLDAAGRASFGYRTVGAGVARIDAAVGGLPPVTVSASRAAAGWQQMITWSTPVTAHAGARYQGRLNFAARYECSSTCNGHPRVSLTACAPGGAYASRITFAYGRRRHSVDFAAAADRRCATWATRMPDGTRVSAGWAFHTPSGWTAPLPVGGSFVVDCPPVPPVAVSLGLDCRTAALTVVLGRRDGGGALVPLHNASRHPMVLDVGGAAAGHFGLAPGATATPHSFALGCSSTAEITVRAGIERADGSYNYGHLLRVVLS